MESFFLAAAFISAIVSVVHSFMGEIFIFQMLRKSGVIPTSSAHPLSPRDIRMLWAAWHLVAIFGFTFAALLFRIGTGEMAPSGAIVNPLMWGFAGGAGIILVASKGKHPGWAGLLAVAVLLEFGSS